MASVDRAVYKVLSHSPGYDPCDSTTIPYEYHMLTSVPNRHLPQLHFSDPPKRQLHLVRDPIRQVRLLDTHALLPIPQLLPAGSAQRRHDSLLPRPRR